MVLFLSAETGSSTLGLIALALTLVRLAIGKRPKVPVVEDCSTNCPFPNSKGGPLAVTDANLILGRLLPQYFPAIFGPNENEPLDIEATRKSFEIMARQVKEETGKDMSVEDIALG